jgi:hypothetical protein
MDADILEKAKSITLNDDGTLKDAFMFGSTKEFYDDMVNLIAQALQAERDKVKKYIGKNWREVLAQDVEMEQKLSVAKEALRKMAPTVEKAIREYKLQYTKIDTGESGLPLVDALTPPGAPTIKEGQDEMDMLVDDVLSAVENIAQAALEAKEPKMKFK